MLKEFHKQVKKHIDVIAQKYILPAEKTVDFAFMYVPGEPVFYEIYNTTELVNYGAEKRVILVSPNSFSYMLKIVLVSLEGEQADERAKLVLQELKAIQQDSLRLNSELNVLQGHVKNTGAQMDKVSSSYATLGSKVDNAGRLIEDQKESVQQLELEAEETTEVIEKAIR